MKGLKLFFIITLITLADNAFSQSPVLPEFTFYSLDGIKFTKDNIQTRTNSIFIFFDVTCGHCQKETEKLGNSFSKFRNTAFYLISMDEVPAIKKFMGSYGKAMMGKKNVTILQDKDRQFIPRFMPTRYPALFIYSPNGSLIKYFSGEADMKEIIEAATK